MAKIANLQEVAVTELKPYERNAKIHGKAQIEKLKASIEAFGFLTPCLIDRNMNLIAGHGRVMGDSMTGGGLHGKDLSKADVSVNIYAWLKAQRTGKVVEMSCAIGDEFVDDVPYSRIVEIARDYIRKVGGFEKFAEWGLV